MGFAGWHLPIVQGFAVFLIPAHCWSAIFSRLHFSAGAVRPCFRLHICSLFRLAAFSFIFIRIFIERLLLVIPTNIFKFS